MFTMTRTFHTVGQGAFYNEDRDCYFTMIYDCGSYGDNG
jgi:hypothetical protein